MNHTKTIKTTLTTLHEQTQQWWKEEKFTHQTIHTINNTRTMAETIDNNYLTSYTKLINLTNDLENPNHEPILIHTGPTILQEHPLHHQLQPLLPRPWQQIKTLTILITTDTNNKHHIAIIPDHHTWYNHTRNGTWILNLDPITLP